MAITPPAPILPPGLVLPPGARPAELVWIAPGSFTMNCPPVSGSRGHAFPCRITRGFWLGRYPVTQAQWRAVMPSNPSTFASNGDGSGSGGGGDRPVEGVGWLDAVSFCQELTRRGGAELPRGYAFGLPTQAQWEYACRAGTTTRYHGGDSLDDLDRVAWHRENSGRATHPVGGKQPNAWGLHDMHGNVFEWCHDNLDDFPTGQVDDWEGVADGKYRIARGGCWSTYREDSALWAGSYAYLPPTARSAFFGMRLCLRQLAQPGAKG